MNHPNGFLMQLILLCVSVESYTIRYNDCTKPSKIKAYSTETSCKDIPSENKEKKMIQILQAVSEVKRIRVLKEIKPLDENAIC